MAQAKDTYCSILIGREGLGDLCSIKAPRSIRLTALWMRLARRAAVHWLGISYRRPGSVEEQLQILRCALDDSYCLGEKWAHHQLCGRPGAERKGNRGSFSHYPRAVRRSGRLSLRMIALWSVRSGADSAARAADCDLAFTD